ncbi:MAG: acyl carrier protein [Deltaproteobacteria bacterium]|nr:acyl carrier protein [Deltaproteobacteria bacterium]
MDDIEIQIRDFIRENFVLAQDEQGFSEHDSFLDSGLIDSTGILELIAFVEESFDIEILDEEMVPENLDSISNVANFIRSKKP